MYKGIYIALSGGAAKQSQMEIITNNLANANTLGFKREKMSFQEYLVTQLNGTSDDKESRVLTDVSTIATDFSEGSLVRTGNTLDVALEGKGFISLEGGQYTRRGDLRIEKGYLVAKNGLKVLGATGPIQIPPGKVEISTAGEISVNGAAVGAIRLVDFPDLTVLKKAGEDFFSAETKGVPLKATMKQGYLESSNVDVVREMIGMITASRELETLQRAIHAFDDSMAKVTNDMGRV